jgi:fructosamine-3-kinase
MPESADAVVVKRRTDAPPTFFAWEAAGLDWLRAAGGVDIVEVRDVGAHHITLDRVDEHPASGAAAEQFGRDLAVTHSAGAATFGAGPPDWTGDGFIGRQPLALQSFSTWGKFYARTRVLPYARAAHRVGNLDPDGVRLIERVCTRLADGHFDDDRPPSRIHGDLWAGNVLYAGNDGAGGVQAVLIDPAAHGGHGLADLAMLALFGTPYLSRVQSAYAEAAGLAAEWRELIGLHQLHPLLVHAVSHGAGYGRQACDVASGYT